MDATEISKLNDWSNRQKSELYCCPHCGKPTTDRVIGMIGVIGKKIVRTMCKECEEYIGSPAAQLPGATMKNRIEMQAKYQREASK